MGVNLSVKLTQCIIPYLAKGAYCLGILCADFRVCLIYQNGNNDLQCVIFDCLGETNVANKDN